MEERRRRVGEDRGERVRPGIGDSWKMENGAEIKTFVVDSIFFFLFTNLSYIYIYIFFLKNNSFSLRLQNRARND